LGAKWRLGVLAPFIASNQTARAAVFHAASNKALFGVIGNISGENGKDSLNEVICTSHLDPAFPGFN
jgi:hypothetical protein